MKRAKMRWLMLGLGLLLIAVGIGVTPSASAKECKCWPCKCEPVCMCGVTYPDPPKPPQPKPVEPKPEAPEPEKPKPVSPEAKKGNERDVLLNAVVKEQRPQAEKFLEWKGSYYEGLKEPKLMVIKDQETWDNIYRTISGAVKLTLDFSHYMVIAIFMGEKRTGGYSVNILKAEEMDGVEVMEYMEKGKGQVKPLSRIAKKVFVVVYEEISPGPRSLVTMALTTPYHVKAVRRSDLPVVFIRYEKMTD